MNRKLMILIYDIFIFSKQIWKDLLSSNKDKNEDAYSKKIED